MIYLQKDLGTTITLGATLISIFFVAGMKLSHLLVMIGGAAIGLTKAITDKDYTYRMRRFTAFF